MNESLEQRSFELQPEIDSSALVVADDPVVLEPIDYSPLTTDQLCDLWLEIHPDDLRRSEKMAEVARCLAGKVDRLDEIHGMSEANAHAFDAMKEKYIERYVRPLQQRADQERRRAVGIENLLLYLMKKNDLPELQGTTSVAKLKVNTGNPASEWKREPTAADMAKFGESFVELVPHHFEWNKANCKKAVMAGQLPEFDALKLTPKESIKFEIICDIQAIPPKRKKASKK